MDGLLRGTTTVHATFTESCAGQALDSWTETHGSGAATWDNRKTKFTQGSMERSGDGKFRRH
jgi:hypothetical protein